MKHLHMHRPTHTNYTFMLIHLRMETYIVYICICHFMINKNNRYVIQLVEPIAGASAGLSTCTIVIGSFRALFCYVIKMCRYTYTTGYQFSKFIRRFDAFCRNSAQNLMP